MLLHNRRLNRSIVFVGMMGAGKTTVARGIARLFNVPFKDTDVEIEKQEMATVREIFAARGETYFRTVERHVLRRVLGGKPASIALGGGTYLDPRNRRYVESLAVSVWLKTDESVLWNRVKHKTTRPLLQTEDPRATLRTLIRERSPIYKQARIHVVAEDRAIRSKTVQKVANLLLSTSQELEIFIECS
ncbi:MAG: shikimate kinase [Rhodobacteraceae bacterium]|nr:shikimate kinase [Paracoccaceae bacterium]